MAVYDFTFLLVDKEYLTNLKAAVEGVGARVTQEEAWGQKHLTYPIKKNDKADFYNWKLEMGEKDSKELARRLVNEEKLLRYLLLKIDEKPAKVTKAAPSKK